jgi:predicted amidohydrolase
MIKMGMVQTSPVFGDKHANWKQIESLAGNQTADLWVIPELALTGYEFANRKQSMELAEEIPGGDSCQWLQKFCAERNCHAVMGIAERDGAQVYNSAVMMGPKGQVGKYRKLHLFDQEKTRFDAGNLPLPVFDLGFARVGVMICFDWRFPEATRTLTLRGAQIIAHPSNLVLPHCQAAMVTRALENRVFCATANRIGTEYRHDFPVTFTGGSVVVTPDGMFAARASATEMEVMIVEIDPAIADNKRVLELNDLLKDRRADYYES